jgi:hypothetical protein
MLALWGRIASSRKFNAPLGGGVRPRPWRVFADPLQRSRPMRRTANQATEEKVRANGRELSCPIVE